MGGRQGNLDLVVEHFLGPKGILNTKGPQAIYDILFKTFTESSEKVKEALNRGRRSVKTEIDGFDKNVSNSKNFQVVSMRGKPRNFSFSSRIILK